MTLAPVRPVPALPRPDSRDRVLPDLLTDLASLGLHARVRTDWVAGDPDVRVQAWRADGGATVELLWASPDAAKPRQVDAVRIQGEDRAVWRSPHGRCADADIVRFLCDLLLLDAAALEDRYLLLG